MKILVVWATLVSCSFLQGCATSAQSGETADCKSIAISGRYHDLIDPGGVSLTKFLTEKTAAAVNTVELRLSVDSLSFTSGTLTKVLSAGKDFVCGADGRVTLKREDSSHILLPPLVDQTKTMTYVLTAGRNGDLVMTT